MLTFIGFKQLMREKRELTTEEKADLKDYFEERKTALASVLEREKEEPVQCTGTIDEELTLFRTIYAKEIRQANNTKNKEEIKSLQEMRDYTIKKSNTPLPLYSSSLKIELQDINKLLDKLP